MKRRHFDHDLRRGAAECWGGRSLEPGLAVRSVRRICSVIIRAWLRIYFRFEIVGQENLRTNRSLVMVANHASHLDTLCLLAALPFHQLNRAFPAAAADYFSRNVIRRWFAAVVINALPFRRQASARQSLSNCAELLNVPGCVLIIFPEGTRSQTGTIQKFKSGIGALVAGLDVAVVPCYIEGAYRAWPKGRNLPCPSKVRMIVGAPRNFATVPRDKHEACAIAAELREAVQQLSEK